MLDSIKGMFDMDLKLKIHKFYGLEELKGGLESNVALTVAILVGIFILIFIAIDICVTTFGEKESHVLVPSICLILLFIDFMFITIHELERPIAVSDVGALVEAVEDGEYKGVYFLKSAYGVEDIQDDILYLTKQSILEGNYDNVIIVKVEKEDVAEEELITVSQQVEKFEKDSKYQAILVDEGTPNEHMLLIELVVDGAVIKLDDYAYIKNEKRYKVEQIDESFVMLKEEDLK